EPEVVAVLEAARRQVEQHPGSAANWGEWGLVLRAHGFDEVSNECFARAEERDARDARWPSLQGLYFLLHDSERALGYLERAAQIAPAEQTSVRLRLAEALLERDRLEEAEREMQAAQRLEPRNGRASFGLGLLSARRGNWEQAKAYFAMSA